MRFEVDGRASVVVEPAAVVVAGFTGRNRASVDAHIDELRAAGVPVPETVPTFYPAPPSLLTQEARITVVGPHTSGEAEVALFWVGEVGYVTVASDHTDRAAETLDIALSKRVCAKPIARVAWPLASVRDRWDELVLESWIEEGGVRTLYQSGRVGEILEPGEILAAMPSQFRPFEYVLLTGTLPAIGGVRPSRRFEARLTRPDGESMCVSYEVDALDS